MTAVVARLSGAAALAAVCLCAHAREAPQAVRLATLEWPPYTGQALPGEGSSAQVVRAAFGALGYQLHTGFYPWSRAMAALGPGSAYVGYFPEYASARTMRQCLLSAPIGSSRLGLAQLQSRPVTWQTVWDLSSYRIGVVRDYINSEQLDAAIAAGQQQTDTARDDTQNLKKLLAGRIDMAVIDAAVMEHLMKTDPALQPHRGKVVFAERALETKRLYVCFRRDSAGRRARALFNAGLRKTATGPGPGA